MYLTVSLGTTRPDRRDKARQGHALFPIGSAAGPFTTDSHEGPLLTLLS